jgi:predicted ATPase
MSRRDLTKHQSSEHSLDLRNKKWNIIGREKELNELNDTVVRCQSGQREVVFISGPVGVGKTTFVRSLQDHSDCFFACGMFDEEQTQPFEAIVTLLTEIIYKVDEEESIKEYVSDKITSELTLEEICTLKQLCSEFRRFLNQSLDHTEMEPAKSLVISVHKKDEMEVLTKIKFAIRTFLRIVSNQVEKVFTLCFFDLHFADDASISIIEFLVHDYEFHRFLMVLSFVDKEDNMDDKKCRPIYKLKNDLLINPEYMTTVIKLENLKIDDINEILSLLMKMSLTDTLSLAAILFTRTNGNLFFILQILENWQNDHVLRFDQQSLTWKWDLDLVRTTSLSEQVVDLVSTRIQRLSLPMQFGLQLGACLGESFRPSILQLISRALSPLPFNMDDFLSLCLKERLLELLSDGRVMFLHRKIRQAALLQLPKGEEINKVHLRIGLFLLKYLQDSTKSHQNLLFLCADQLHLGCSHMTCNSDKLDYVKLNEVVGRKSKDISAFSKAALYFRRGINTLTQMNIEWDDFRVLFESLYLGLAEVLYCVGQFEPSLEAIRDLVSQTPSKPVEIGAKLIKLHILKAECKLREFVSDAVTFLLDFGTNLTWSSPTICALQLRRILHKLKGMSNEEIMNLPKLLNIEKLAVMKVLNLMLVPLETLGMVNVCFLAMNKAVMLTLNHGLSEFSPEAFVLLGTYFISEKNMLSEGYRMGELALAMSNNLEPNMPDARVSNLVYSMTKPWQTIPLSKCISPLIEGHKAAILVGDLFSAFMAINVYLSVSYFSSSTLPPLLVDMENYSKQMLAYGQKTIFLQILPIWQCVLNLTGRSDDPLDFERGEAIEKENLVGNLNDVGRQSRWSYLMQIAFYIGDMRLASEMSAKLREINIGFMKAHVFYQTRVFFFGLIAISNARRFEGKRKYKTEATKHIQEMRTWVERGASNLVHKLLILESEYESLSAKSGILLQSRYECAIASARKSGFLQDAAIAAQLASEVLFQFDDTAALAETYVHLAYKLWMVWGAIAIADNLATKMSIRYPSIVFESQFHDSYHDTSSTAWEEASTFRNITCKL